MTRIASAALAAALALAFALPAAAQRAKPTGSAERGIQNKGTKGCDVCVTDGNTGARTKATVPTRVRSATGANARASGQDKPVRIRVGRDF